MKTDRELLELAADAAGLSYFAVDAGLNTGSDAVPIIWNPLVDDGDALRLAARLHMNLEINYGTACAIWFDMDLSETHGITEYCDEAFDGWKLKQAAVRRAIVRAAAQIGETK